MRLLGRVLPTPRRLSKPPVWRPLNSTCGPNPGSGDVLPRIIVTIADSFVIVFKELSTSICLSGRYLKNSAFTGCIFVPGLVHWEL